MKRLTMMIALIAMVVCMMACGDDDITAPIANAVNLAGKVAKGYVSFALVIADRNNNFALDAGEVSTYSDANGDFDLTVPGGYGNYVLVSLGGTIKDSLGNDVPAPPLMAPAGSENITPLTTLVALNPALETQIEAQTGEAFDVDLAGPGGVSATTMRLSQAVRAIMDIMTDPDAPIVSDPEDLMMIVEHLATSLDGQDLVDDTSLSTALQAGLQNAMNDNAIIDPNQVNITDVGNVITAVGNAIDGVLGDVPEGAVGVQENPALLGTIKTLVATAVVATADNTQTVSIRVGQVEPLDENDQVVPNTGQPDVYTEANALTITQLRTMLIVVNKFGTDRQFNSASLFINISDANSSRRATAEVTKVDVTVTAGNTLVITTSAQTRLRINGVNAQGTIVTADIANASAAGDDQIITTAGTEVTVNLERLQTKIQNTVGAGSDLFEVSLVGNHAIGVSAAGVPLTAYNRNIVVQ